jgi:hypothetical protein
MSKVLLHPETTTQRPDWLAGVAGFEPGNDGTKAKQNPLAYRCDNVSIQSFGVSNLARASHNVSSTSVRDFWIGRSGKEGEHRHAPGQLHVQANLDSQFLLCLACCAPIWVCIDKLMRLVRELPIKRGRTEVFASFNLAAPVRWFLRPPIVGARRCARPFPRWPDASYL